MRNKPIAKKSSSWNWRGAPLHPLILSALTWIWRWRTRKKLIDVLRGHGGTRKVANWNLYAEPGTRPRWRSSPKPHKSTSVWAPKCYGCSRLGGSWEAEFATFERGAMSDESPLPLGRGRCVAHSSSSLRCNGVSQCPRELCCSDIPMLFGAHVEMEVPPQVGGATSWVKREARSSTRRDGWWNNRKLPVTRRPRLTRPGFQIVPDTWSIGISALQTKLDSLQHGNKNFDCIYRVFH